MKKITKVLTLLTATLLTMAFVSCKNPGKSDPQPEPQPQPVTETVIFENAEGLDLAWGYTIIDAEKIADATNDSVLEFAVTKSANDYQVIQICLADNSQIVSGVVTNASINDDGNGFVPSFATATFTYKPTAAEWAQLKTDGIRFQGHGIKVSKITLK